MEEGEVINIPWDRHIRLQGSAREITQRGFPQGTTILDVGGGDGALAWYLKQAGADWQVVLVDPETTGGDGLNLPFEDNSFELVVSVDALEHIPADSREQFLKELCRVTRKGLFIHYPEARSMPAQRLAHSLHPNDQFIREHVEFVLPSTKEVVQQLARILQIEGDDISCGSHVSIQLWLAWWVLFQVSKEQGTVISDYLKSSCTSANDESCLYDWIYCEKRYVQM